MRFTDLALITPDVPTLARFYEAVFGAPAEGDVTHSVVRAAGLQLALYNRGAAQADMGFDFTGAGTGLLTIGFDVDDVNAEHERVRQLGVDGLTEPQLWPWGAKSFRFRDPDGNVIVFRSWDR